MKELLFKLKKDGKTVGYLKIGTIFSIEGIWFAKNQYGNSWQRCPQKIIDGDFDTAHPFVTKDKTGKDVFAGDKIKRVNYTGDPQHREEAGQEGTIVWHHGLLRWNLKIGSKNFYQMEDLVDSEIFEDGIELIEE